MYSSSHFQLIGHGSSETTTTTHCSRLTLFSLNDRLCLQSASVCVLAADRGNLVKLVVMAVADVDADVGGELLLQMQKQSPELFESCCAFS